jgi:hypothetical protein
MLIHVLKNLVLAFAFFPAVLPAQITYQHYLNSSFQWWEMEWYTVFPGPSQSVCQLEEVSVVTYYYYHVTGTDSIDGNAWYLIHRDGQEFATCGDTLFAGSPFSYAGVTFRLREDSTGQVWKRDPNGTIFRLYQHSPGTGIGDTIFNPGSGGASSITVGAIDTVYFGQDARIRYHGDCGPDNTTDFLIEGGITTTSFGGLPACFQIASMPQNRLICAEKDGHRLDIFQGTNYTMVCGIPSHVTPLGIADKWENSLLVSWNGRDETLLLHNWQPQSRRGWAVYDIAGKRLAEGDHLEAEIRVAGLSAGMYVFVVEAKATAKPLVRRFVKF